MYPHTGSRIAMEGEEEEEAPPAAAVEEEAAKPSLFPLFPASDASHSHQITTISIPTSTAPPQWLSNSSFTADLSIINDAVSNQLEPELEEEEENDEAEEKQQPKPKPPSYEFLESSSSESDRDFKKKTNTKKKRKRKSKSSKERDGARKSGVRAWAGSDTKPSNSKDYYFDSHGDLDNLAFGSLYR